MFKVRPRHLRVTQYPHYKAVLPFVAVSNPNGVQVMSGKKNA